jgi:hypothetical protein
MVDNYYRSLEHRGMAVTSKVAKEAAKLAKVSADCAKTLIARSEMQLDQIESLRFKFESAGPNRSHEDVGEILH